MNNTGTISGINGPVIYLKGDPGFKMNEMVYVGRDNLVGEVIGLTSGRTIVQVYEETSGLKPGETVTASGSPVSVTLAPGILNNIFDGIERPLTEIAKTGGAISTAASMWTLWTAKRNGTPTSPLKRATVYSRAPSSQRFPRPRPLSTRS